MLRTAVLDTTHHNNKLQTSRDQYARMRPRMVANMFHPTILYPKGPGWRGQRYTSHIYGDLKCIRERGAWSALPCLFNLAEDPNKLSGMHGARYDIFTADNKSWN